MPTLSGIVVSSGTAMSIAEHRARLSFLGPVGERMAYWDLGPKSGRTIVLLHGMPTSSWLYRAVAPLLAREGLRVVVPDMLGFGASDKPKGAGPYALATQADRLRDLMTHLGVSRWTQVVHDLGGPWTWELADRDPGRLEGLVVMNTTAYLDGFHPPAMIRMAGSPIGPLMAFMMRNRLTGPSQVRALFHQMTVRPGAVSPEMVEGHWKPLHEGTTRAFLAFARVFPWWFLQFDRYRAALRRLDIPAATVWGEHDKVLDVDRIPMQFSRDLRIPPERMHRLDAGHFLQEDRPSELAAILAGFMEAR